MSIWQQELTAGVWLVGISGRLDQTQTPDLEEQLDELLRDGHHRIVVDMSEVTYINSGGLRCLVTAWRRAKKEGGNVVLTGLKERVNEVFSMVGFDKVFDVYPTRAAAEAAWQEKG
ncbi:MAG: STAS domain-containing protein [Candidatus Promineifilaceae bacterium]|nr:STAS domain-containing protein [Candidatus Promineifilaceae bacterium]